MAVELRVPEVDGLAQAVGALREWQHDEAPMQLHPGDVGWFWRAGAAATAAALRTWSREGEILAVGLLDGPDLLRMTMAPHAHRDQELGHRLAEDLTAPERGVLPTGPVSVEAPLGALVHDLLFERDWASADDPWTPLHRDLAGPVPDPGMRVEPVGPGEARAWTAVQRASFERSTFTDERWQSMAAGLPYADGRCLLAYDESGTPVASVAVWSAGPGRPGLVEPMGVHPEHRGRGFGRAVTVGAAAALHEMGASSAIVCTPSATHGGAGGSAALATYASAGFQPRPEVRDTCRLA